MERKNSNRTRIIGLRLTSDEYLKIEKKWKASTCRKLSEYVRRSLFEKARPFMEQHEIIRLYLDRDTTGQNYSHYALSLSNKYKDESKLYKHYKDFNDWMMNIGKFEKKNLDQKL